MASPLKSPAGSLMTGDNWASVPVVSAGRRRRERRRGIASVCAALASTLTRTDSEALRLRLLDGIRRIVPGARTISIRDWQVGETRVDPPQQAGLVTFEIPTSDPRRIAILDAVPCPGRQLDDWDLQTLALSSQVGALVLEVELQRLAARQDVRPQVEHDGAAPLIGSTLVMQRLRETIERVASSDFTVLIEGPIQRQ